MTPLVSNISEGRTVLFFGPQASSLDVDSIRSSVLAEERFRWIRHTVVDLPNVLCDMLHHWPNFASQAKWAYSVLRDLGSWLNTEDSPAILDPSVLTNITLNPLVVISHMIHFIEYLDLIPPRKENSGETLLPSNLQDTFETLGLCTGLLSSLAVSSSQTRLQLELYGSVAIRSAMAVGLVVDARDRHEAHGPSKSMTTRWHSVAQKQKLLEILATDPETYVSVHYDSNRVTVTSPAATTATFKQAFLAAGLTVAEIGVRGRFHWQGHAAEAESLIKFCDMDSRFQFADMTALALSNRSFAGGTRIQSGSLHTDAIRSILLEPPQWEDTIRAVYSSTLVDPLAKAVLFGNEPCLPTFLLATLSSRVLHMGNLNTTSRCVFHRPSSGTEIAVIGMSAKVAGADDLEAFWDILSKGESQHQEVPAERFTFETAHRELDQKRKWFGNFLNDHDKFDHRFFKKSPREAESMDPQQRQLLQIAYQAVQQTGYFHHACPDLRVGCYIGVCCVDYENNLSCYTPNAFTATGHLRGFIAGKVSHYFGWTGPALTIDSACSSSAVAVHQACRAIINNECTAALVGGTHIMTSPLWFQNLAGASFLSKTGQCKPFDSRADGYCRGEGVAAVFLKRMSAALADGDQVLGVIASTVVQQNENCTSIVVPNEPSLSNIFRSTLDRASLKPESITVVEAHGTGTPVGDPVEYQSIQNVLGKARPPHSLNIGSAKGLVGHCECASGIVSLVKVLLMIQKESIPPQASFNIMSPVINKISTNVIRIAQHLSTWDAPFRAALINSYGASGSNVSMIITEPPPKVIRNTAKANPLPFWLSAMSEKGLQAYAIALRKYLDVQRESISLQDLAFNVSRQSNHSLQCRLLFTCHSIEDLEEKLTEYGRGDMRSTTRSLPESPPLVLCFGGQVSRSIGLCREVYEQIILLRDHLNRCNRRCIALGIGSIFPAIFQQAHIDDIVTLQTSLFSMQYACAKSWMDAGVQPSAVLGHSFGELTALCVANVLSLDDALRMVAARARVIQDFWGVERGGMIALEGELSIVQSLLATSNANVPGEQSAEIACYNGPKNFTIAGSTRALETLNTIRLRSPHFADIKAKKLDVTHAFHSTLVEPLRSKLDEATRGLTFHEPTIHIERSTEMRSDKIIDNPLSYVADHMRMPVFFYHALQRLDKRLPGAIYLEAGSSSRITNIASRALGGLAGRHFQAMNITTSHAWENLTKATVNLWNAGLNFSFWAHAPAQTNHYKLLLLPPYQFEKTRHWLEYKMPPHKGGAVVPVQEDRSRTQQRPDYILSFEGYQDTEQCNARFRVNTTTPGYLELMASHVFVHTAPICPATVQIDIAIQALKLLVPTIGYRDQPHIQDVENQVPICTDVSQAVWLDLTIDGDPKRRSWHFRFFGTRTGSDQKLSQKHMENGTTFTIGVLVVTPMDDKETRLEFARYARLTGHVHCVDLLDHQTGTEKILQGQSIYNRFSDIVNYGEQYRGLQRLVGKGQLSAGRVLRAYNPRTWFDATLSDAFAQVIGIWINCMTESDTANIYVARGFEKWMRSPELDHANRPNSYDVLAYHQGPQKNSCLSDVFVFRSDTGQLVEIVLGFHFVRVSRMSMVKLLTRLTRSQNAQATITQSTSLLQPKNTTERSPPSTQITMQDSSAKEEPEKEAEPPRLTVLLQLRLMIANLVVVDPEQISINSELSDIGVDSLMAMEVVSEIKNVFNCPLALNAVANVTTMSQLVRVVESALDLGSSEDSLNHPGAEKEDQRPSAVETDVPDISVGVAVDMADLLAFLAQCLDIEAGELSASTELRDLRIKSLLFIEMREKLEDKFGFQLDDSLVLEDLTIDGLYQILLDAAVNTVPGPVCSPFLALMPHRLPSSGLSPSYPRPLFSVVDILTAFLETKAAGDSFIASNGCSNYVKDILPKQTQLCVLHTLEAFERMGSSIRAVRPGQKLKLFAPLPGYVTFVTRLTEMLEIQSGLIQGVEGPDLTVLRTEVAYPTTSSTVFIEELRNEYPQYQNVNDLIFYVGSQLDCALRGEIGGIELIFGNEEGRELISGFYSDWIMNICYYEQMRDFLHRLLAHLPSRGCTLRILEVGAGTGGTSKWLIPFLAKLDIHVEYTFTDLAPSLVAGACKTFKPYSSMIRFRVLDIEEEPADDLVNTQHLVIASNAVHATRSLVKSAMKMKKMLQPNGILMLLEMIEPLYWIDMVFGLFKGWWLFADGRSHALASPVRWKTDLQAAGFGVVEWSDGLMPENSINKFIIAVAGDPDRIGAPPRRLHASVTDTQNLVDRRIVIDGLVRKYTAGIYSTIQVSGMHRERHGHGVLITGGTGSVGAHVVARLVQMPSVTTVICLNRRSQQDGRRRQLQSLAAKKLYLPEEALAKIQVFETDLAKDQFGLLPEVYRNLLESTTHIVHSAWTMSIKQPVQGFETQFRIIHNLIKFACNLSSVGGAPVGFQFISSIATVGYYPIWKQDPRVPEERLPLDAVLPIGYGDAKYICERILDKTLYGDPQRFRTSTVRLGQVGASKLSGYWNPMEHLPFVFKSAQTINMLPDLDGPLSWTPVDDVAGILVDLLFVESPYPIYHIENPVTQPWQQMLLVLANGLGVPPNNRLPFDEWVARVRDFPADPLAKNQNPAALLTDFLGKEFQHLSAGGLILDTTRARKHSPTLRAVGPVDPDHVRKFIQYWKSVGFIA
ncbi:unnamed protein product [Penicillium salamii]|uniref:Uncharacterized protein n=1 Tax=Penicillium salamii TaxID=1612424 RepID=A0A9W4I498_9EURO|nr:unnamed protein product [Penicillium salamii]